jgi:alpha-galactosidase
MWNALKTVGIPRLLVCQWGTPFVSPSNGVLEGPVDWTKGISTSFRLSDDVSSNWAAITRIIDQSIYIAASNKTGPGNFADADMLEVGSSQLSTDEQSTHFAYWAMTKSALVIGTNVASMSNTALTILQNKDLIAINQDSLGKPIVLVQRWTGDRDLYRGPLANGDDAVLVISYSNQARSDIVIDLASQLGITRADVKNLWTGQVTTGVTGRFSVGSVGAHGSVPLRLSNIQRASQAQPTVRWVEAESGTLGGGASVASCSGCSGGKKAGYVGSGGTLTLSGLSATTTTSVVLFDYVNCDIGYGGGVNARTATVSVNGGQGVQVSFPISGYNWDASVTKGYRVELAGFKVGQSNTIAISQAGSYGPDLDRIGIIQ